MPLMTVSQGGPTPGTPEAEIEPGVYPVILTSIDGPKTIVPKTGPNAGLEVQILDWNFAVDEGPYENTVLQATSSTNSGPRSKMYGFLTALLNGKPPAVGQSFEAADLTGRRALATVSRGESGWPRVENLGAMPASMQRPQEVAPAQPTALPGEALANAPQQPSSDLPF